MVFDTNGAAVDHSCEPRVEVGAACEMALRAQQHTTLANMETKTYFMKYASLEIHPSPALAAFIGQTELGDEEDSTEEVC